ncbi:hypothetical protein NMY22_g17891 [Coprinellus aureogranulatus]|nr:hypothetical protein NMY22_g17891 [Coprinellus aureogranulatus]
MSAPYDITNQTILGTVPASEYSHRFAAEHWGKFMHALKGSDADVQHEAQSFIGHIQHIRKISSISRPVRFNPPDIPEIAIWNVLQVVARAGLDVWHMVSIDLNAAIDLDRPFTDGQTALEIASRSRNWDLVHALVDSGANVNVFFTKWERDHVATALHAACFHMDFNTIYFLLENGADPNASGFSDSEGVYPWLRRWQTVDPFVSDSISLWSAMDYSHDSCRVRVDRDEKLRHIFQLGTPIAFASALGAIQLVTHLLACGADPNLSGGWYDTALQAACAQGKPEVVKLLLKHGADPNLTGGVHGSALHACVEKRQLDCALALLESNGNSNLRGVFSPGDLPAHLLLIPSINADQHGSTPLHKACHWGSVNMANLLLDYGADPKTRNNEGKTILQYALEKRGKDSKLVQMLRQRGVTE